LRPPASAPPRGAGPQAESVNSFLTDFDADDFDDEEDLSSDFDLALEEEDLDEAEAEEAPPSGGQREGRGGSPPSRRSRGVPRSGRSAPRKAAPKPGGPAGARKPGVVQRLLGLFRRPAKDKAAATPVDRAAFRDRARAVLLRLQSVTEGAPARLAALRAVLDDLEALFEALVTAGERDPAAERLGEVALRVRRLLGAAAAPEADVQAAWADAVAALEGWLALADPPAAPPREGFWK
jgi:hypothetical protein